MLPQQVVSGKYSEQVCPADEPPIVPLGHGVNGGLNVGMCRVAVIVEPDDGAGGEVRNRGGDVRFDAPVVAIPGDQTRRKRPTALRDQIRERTYQQPNLVPNSIALKPLVGGLLTRAVNRNDLPGREGCDHGTSGVMSAQL